MRRHVMLFRSMKRRYRLCRPRYSLRVLWYGGTTFTMVLFTLLLVSSGLMYFYFNKCRVQERELDKWRAGIKVEKIKTADVSPTEKIKNVVSAVGESIRSMPAPSMARAREEEAPKEPEVVKAGSHGKTEVKQVAKQQETVAPLELDEKQEQASAPAETPIVTKATPNSEDARVAQKQRVTKSTIAQADEAAEAKWAEAIEKSRESAPRRIDSAYDDMPAAKPATRSTAGDRITIKVPSSKKSNDDVIGSYLKAR